MSKAQFFNVACMSFNTICKNKILAIISEFTVAHLLGSRIRNCDTNDQIAYNTVYLCRFFSVIR